MTLEAQAMSVETFSLDPEVPGLPIPRGRGKTQGGRGPRRVSVAQAKALQERLKCRVIQAREFPPEEIRLVAGTDISYLGDRKLSLAAVVVMEYRSLRVVEERVAAKSVDFPYVPGLLSFRELPALLEALGGLRCRPDVIIADGQGLAHPRFFGLACHLGVVTGIPTIGCAKSRLVGEHGEPGPEKGDWTPLLYQGRTVGAVLRTRKGVKPVYVSVGHKTDLEFCIRVVMDCLRGFRLPEPQREAHRLAEACKKKAGPGSGVA
jgi:deoxyribonuclease V